MNATQLVEYLNTLSPLRHKAMTHEQIFSQLPSNGSHRPFEHKDRVRITDHMSEMEAMKLVERLDNPIRYYLNESLVFRYLLHTKAALNIALTQGATKHLADELQLDALSAITSRGDRMTAREQVLKDRVRLVPDGWERLPYAVLGSVVSAVLDALERKRKVRLMYQSVKDLHQQVPHRPRDVTPLGFVLKETTAYLIASIQIDGQDRLVEFNLVGHRCQSAEVLDDHADLTQVDFDIDQYITENHNLCHLPPEHDRPAQLAADGMFDLVLHIDPAAEHHFRERPFSTEQALERVSDNCFELRARVRFSIQTEPFLWSHSPWVNVAEPQWLRDRLQQRLGQALDRYKPQY